jgi:hypothetical protein
MEMEEQNTSEEATQAGLDRREFALRSIMAMLSGVAITISGCGGGGGGSPTQPNPQPSSSGDKIGTVADNHGHTARITAAELSAGGAVTLMLRGTADHPHTLQLTAAEVASIAAGMRVGKGSSEDAFHTHAVTFN